jgi:hypothetical protein
MSRTHIIAMALASMTLAAAGCGGGSSGRASSNDLGKDVSSVSSQKAGGVPSSAPLVKAVLTGLSRAEFIAKGNAICKRLRLRIEAVNIRMTQEYGSALPRLAAQERAAFAEMAALRLAKSSLDAEWRQYIGEGLKLADYTAQLAQTLTSSDRKSSRALAVGAVRTQRAMHLIAGRLGVDRCARLV